MFQANISIPVYEVAMVAEIYPSKVISTSVKDTVESLTRNMAKI